MAASSSQKSSSATRSCASRAHGAWIECALGSRSTSRLETSSITGESANRTRPRSSGPKRKTITNASVPWIRASPNPLARQGAWRSLGRVLTVLRVYGSLRLFATAILARIPATALGLVFVLRTKELTGSFAAAGTAAGLYALAMAVWAPALGRLIDRRGAALVLVVAALGDAAALTVFALLAGGALLAFACAIVSGAATPPVGPSLRTLW